MLFDHVAVVSNNIKESVSWYVDNWKAEVLYQDETWGLIQLGESKIAFVSAHQHPAHICFEINADFIAKNLNDKTFKAHRDGSTSCYVRDPDGNFLEFLYWPDKEKKYDNT